MVNIVHPPVLHYYNLVSNRCLVVWNLINYDRILLRWISNRLVLLNSKGIVCIVSTRNLRDLVIWVVLLGWLSYHLGIIEVYLRLLRDWFSHAITLTNIHWVYFQKTIRAQDITLLSSLFYLIKILIIVSVKYLYIEVFFLIRAFFVRWVSLTIDHAHEKASGLDWWKSTLTEEHCIHF